MAWTSPRTWTTGELVTAAIMNTHIRDNQNVLNNAGVCFVMDGNGAEIESGSKLMWPVPFDCTISRWDLYCGGDASSVAFEFYSVSYGGYPAASEDSINSGSPAYVASATNNRDTNPSSWGALTQGEQLTIVVSSINGITKAYLGLYLDRT